MDLVCECQEAGGAGCQTCSKAWPCCGWCEAVLSVRAAACRRGPSKVILNIPLRLLLCCKRSLRNT